MDELMRFRDAFRSLTGELPFPWQEGLYVEWFSRGRFPASCNLPTGLGKTSVVAIWLIALANNLDHIPRRLIYVVNRRTVVDQTTNEVEKLRTNLQAAGFIDPLTQLCAAPLEGDDAPLAISTLRGQFADNREWSADPSRPAVIVGTVDMIGSRLLFSGYGVGFKLKPLHAGFLGQDVLLVHDEAHLEPAFQTLIETIRDEQKREPAPLGENMRLNVMALSATSRGEKDSFGLTEQENSPPTTLPDPPTEPLHLVWRRLKAKKGLKHHPVKREQVAKQIGLLARLRKLSGLAILVFVRTIQDVKIVQQVLTDKKDGVPSDQVQVLTGTVRGLERDRLAKEDPIFGRFLLKIPRDGRTVYLICTSAGEVGIDLSADHLVCDLTPLDSMTQRFGRVNRRGDGAAEIDLVFESDPNPKEKDNDLEKARRKTLQLLQRLPTCDWIEERHDASPLALRNLNLTDDERKAAFSPEPAILRATDILFDAWAFTTISPPLVRTALPGRSPVEPFLHGISDWQPSETHVAWRKEVEVITGDLLERYKPEDLLEDYPLKPHELLRDRSERVFDDLQAIRKRMGDKAPIWIEEQSGRVDPTTLGELLNDEMKAVATRIAYCRLLLPPFAGGLSKNGTLDGMLDFDSAHKVGYDIADEWYTDKEETIRRRVRICNDDRKFPPPKGMRLVRPSLDFNPRADEDEETDLTTLRFWHWFTQPRGADDDGSKSSRLATTWADHTRDVVDYATGYADVLLKNQPQIHAALVLAARFHDLGKRRLIWQRSIGNDQFPARTFAKSGRLADGSVLRPRKLNENYRHEFGSLLDALNPEENFASQLNALSPDMGDLVLHLIASHHGRGRPHFPGDEALDQNAKEEDSVKVAAEVPRRFARLQRTFGRWGLAYLESLLRAADYAASANPSQTEDQP